MVKNLPFNGDTGLIPGQGTKVSHAAGQLSLCASTIEAVRAGAHEPACVSEDPACHTCTLTQPKTNKQTSEQAPVHYAYFLTRQILNLPVVKSACNEVDPGIKPEDPPEGGNGNPLHYSCLGNPMDRGDSPWDYTELDITERLTLLLTLVIWLANFRVFFFNPMAYDHGNLQTVVFDTGLISREPLALFFIWGPALESYHFDTVPS